MSVATAQFFEHIDAFVDYRKTIYEASDQTIRSNRIDLGLFEAFVSTRILRWVGVAFGGVIALILIIFGIGLLLPQSHTATLSAEYAQPVDSVWAAITDWKSFPAWRANVDEVEARDDGWLERGPSGALPLIVHESDPPRRLVTRIGTGLPFGGTWTYTLRTIPSGSELTITEDGEVYNPIFRVVSVFLDESATIRQYLMDLRRRLGEDVDPI